MFKKVPIDTRKRIEFIDITARVKAIVKETSLQDGLVIVYVPHTTAAVTINEHADPSVVLDMLGYLNNIVPENAGYKHLEGNSDAHIKASLIGASVQIPLVGGELMLGTWQGIFFCEFDGPRRRTFFVSILPG
ncbi:hypothetical protein AT15_07280 [Kosmotoga arenicorallina S304]|uniref:Secondary thiamine-phosphate synthase enzyme n=1 Tax=Kosmotoga arenicorallina S304 TaxID=1453497 RepID=A0A182C737_9BACT|nr:secondary thiamine-phosphate synthase enzyme YjbQ [Kosmotoga arenicorallina]OAA31291.1 hypothetical protein AT15_07280 [Kosmotoga arenicorallina S304]